MSYTTTVELERRYGEDEIRQRERLLGAGAVEAAIGAADAEVDAYLGAIYVVPLTETPPIIARMSQQIARHILLGDAATEASVRDYEAARAFLREVAAGRVQLTVLAGAAQPAAGSAAGSVLVDSSERVFSREARA